MLPPALRKVWPSLVSQIVIVMLGSAVCGQISTPELSYAANLISSRNFRTFEAFFIATGIYLLLAIALRQLLNWAGPRFVFGAGDATMVEFTLWDIFRNLLLAARWTVVLSLIAFVGGGLVGAGAAGGTAGEAAGRRARVGRATCSCSRARRC